MLDGMSPDGRAGDSARLRVRRKNTSDGGNLRDLKYEADARQYDANEYAHHKIVDAHCNDNDNDLPSVRACWL